MTTTPELLEVCYSCAAAANGVYSIEGDGVEAWRIRFAEAVTRNGGLLPIMLWTDNDDGEPFFFSNAPCDYCGERLSGDRCEAILNTNN